MATTSTAPLPKRLGVKPDSRLLVLNAPDGFGDLVGELPEGASLDINPDELPFDVVLLFAEDKATLDRLAGPALAALRPGGTFWVAHPKRASKRQTDLTRDAGWDVITAAGLDGVASISIDATWSGLRFRPVTDIAYTPGSQRRAQRAVRG